MLREQTTKSNRHQITISPLWARVLSVVSIGSLWGWFCLKSYLNDASTGLVSAVGSLALLGVGGSVTLLATQYLNQARPNP